MVLATLTAEPLGNKLQLRIREAAVAIEELETGSPFFVNGLMDQAPVTDTWRQLVEEETRERR